MAWRIDVELAQPAQKLCDGLRTTNDPVEHILAEPRVELSKPRRSPFRAGKLSHQRGSDSLPRIVGQCLGNLRDEPLAEKEVADIALVGVLRPG
jgi:hypothetical protein